LEFVINFNPAISKTVTSKELKTDSRVTTKIVLNKEIELHSKTCKMVFINKMLHLTKMFNIKILTGQVLFKEDSHKINHLNK
jgi:hypothetical protein